MQYEDDFLKIIRGQDWLMDALKTVRSLYLPDWYIAAGAIRNTVWNYLHDYPATLHQNDIDVIYFDSSDMQGKNESLYETALSKVNPNFKWEVVNQARAHMFKHGPNAGRPAVHSSGESIKYWSETPTCIGVRLEDNDLLSICAPYGLDDLMSLTVQPVPKPYQELDLYRERVETKKWDLTWPKLKIVKI